MMKFGVALGKLRKPLLRAAGLAAIAVPIVFGLANATPGRAQSQAQGPPQSQGQEQAPPQAQKSTAAATTYEYEVVSIKLNKSTDFPNATTGDDGFTVTNIPLLPLLFTAFGVGRDQIVGAPDWLSSERYDVNAKIDPSLADAIKKLSPDDKKLAQQQMLQALFADRFKLKFHREKKELQVYTLVVANGGPKFQESKPDDPSADSGAGLKIPDGRGGTGRVQMGGRGTISFHALPITVLAQILSGQLGRTVVDKTGLTGKYDFTWQFTPNQNQGRAGGDSQAPPGGAASGGTPITTLDPGGDAADVFIQVQEQLGLKLESGKGPVEIIVIDHIERPSGN